MLHARKDYDRIQDPENKILPDEPVLVLRAKDKLFVPMCRWYAVLCDFHGRSQLSHAAHNHANAAKDWQERHKDAVKLPDMPADAGRY
jgi:hypothetical protein